MGVSNKLFKYIKIFDLIFLFLDDVGEEVFIYNECQ